MKYSLAKQVNREALAELYLMLSDSLEEKIPDIIWQGSEFEVEINREEVRCEIDYLSNKRGGEFTIKVSWKSPIKKKEKKPTKPSSKRSKEEKEPIAKISSPPSAGKLKEDNVGVEFVEEEEDWFVDDSDWEEKEEVDDWDDEDFEEEW